MSDLHNEFGTFDVPVMPLENEQVLILAGDVDLMSYKDRYIDFLFKMADRFQKVLVVPGNHEFYHGDMDYDLKRIIEEIDDSKYNNIHIMDDDVIDIDGVIFIGSTLWTDLNNNNVMVSREATSYMNDFLVIKVEDEPFNIIQWKSMNEVSRIFIINNLEKYKDKKCVVITHHAPSMLSVADAFKGETLNYAYVNTGLEDIILDYEPELWIHGHMHNTFDYNIGDSKTRVICNPRGYEGYEVNSRFDPNLVIEI